MASVDTPKSKKGDDVNVKVAVRCRPFNKREKDLDAECVVEMVDGKQVAMSDPSKPGTDPHKFTFDHSYFWDTEQGLVYDDLARPIVDQALQGFNGTIFAYGQTGSGKSWSMMGNDEFPGIIPRLNQDLFERVAKMQEDNPKRQFMVLVSYLEIYNEVIKDLLNPSDKKLVIREHPKMGIYVQDLAELVVTSAEDVVKLLEQGNSVRQVAETQMNARSSRSHSCFTIKIQQKEQEEMGGGKIKQTTLNAKINLVDLAGSERAAKTGATGDRLKEGAAINKSLSVLGNVINALAEGGKKHIPYRDSKLTRLLQESLGGNSLTCMIATLSPADDNYDETMSTLKYANRAKNIQNKTVRNEDVSQQIIRELREEIEELRAALEAAQGGISPAAGPSPEQQQHMEKMAEKLANLERAKQESWEEKARLSQLYEEERRKNMENELKIKAVMQNVKEQNVELMKRLRSLNTERTTLVKRFKERKAEYNSTKTRLGTMMGKYQELHSDGGEDGPHAAKLEELLTEIETTHAALEEQAAELQKIKAAIAANEDAQESERAEAAAQRMLLEEESELRKAIEKEEKARLAKEAEAKLEEALQSERAKLAAEAEAERQALLKKYALGSSPGAVSAAQADMPSEREGQLEMELLEARQDKAMLMLEVDTMQQRHDAALRAAEEAHVAEVAQLKRQELRMFRELTEAFEDEVRSLKSRLTKSLLALRQATADVAFLHERNSELERELQAAAAWEPDM